MEKDTITFKRLITTLPFKKAVLDHIKKNEMSLFRVCQAAEVDYELFKAYFTARINTVPVAEMHKLMRVLNIDVYMKVVVGAIPKNIRESMTSKTVTSDSKIKYQQENFNEWLKQLDEHERESEHFLPEDNAF